MTDASTPETGSQISLRDPDVRLMLRVKDGDEEAFEEIVLNYQSRLVQIYFLLVGSQETAEDLAQETFLRIYRSRHGYLPTAKFSTWLFRIANNLASNARRSQARHKNQALKTSADDDARPAENLIAEKSALMPARQFDQKEMAQVVQAALDELTERQRMAVLLHKFEQMSYADIGATMDMTEPAVKSLLSRAREALRVRLEKYVKQGDIWSGAMPTQS